MDNSRNAKKRTETGLRFRSLLLTVSGDYELKQVPPWIAEMAGPWRKASEESAIYAAKNWTMSFRRRSSIIRRTPPS